MFQCFKIYFSRFGQICWPGLSNQIVTAFQLASMLTTLYNVCIYTYKLSTLWTRLAFNSLLRIPSIVNIYITNALYFSYFFNFEISRLVKVLNGYSSRYMCFFFIFFSAKSYANSRVSYEQ